MKPELLKPFSVMSENRFKALAGLIFAGWLLIRLKVIFFSIEQAAWHEELALGTVARELLLGLRTSYWNFQLDAYSGESLILAPIAAVLFKLFGSTLTSLKLLPLIFSTGTLILSVSFIKKYFSNTQALWALFFLAFCPPMIGAHSIIALSAHTESLFLTLCQVWLFFAFFHSNNYSAVLVFLLGLLSGFNFWFYYETIIATAAILILWGITAPKTFVSKKFIFFCAGFIGGASPMLISNLTHQFEGVGFLQKIAVSRSFSEQLVIVPKRILGILLVSLPQSFAFLDPDNLFSMPLAYVFFSLFLLPLFVSIRSSCRRELFRSPVFHFLIIYAAVFLILYGMTELDIPRDYGHLIIFRYYAPLYLFVFMLLGVLSKYAPRGILLILAAMCVISQMPFLNHWPKALPPAVKGYSYYHLGEYWRHALRDPSKLYERIDDISNRIDPKNKKLLIWGASHEYWTGVPFWRSPSARVPTPFAMASIKKELRSHLIEEAASCIYVNSDHQSLRELIIKGDSFVLEDRPYYYKGILADFYGRGVHQFFADPEIYKLIPQQYKQWAFWGLGRFFEANPPDDKLKEKVESFLSNFGAFEKKWYYRGMASALFENYLPGIFIHSDFQDNIREGAEKVPKEYRPDFYWGLGWQLGELYPEDPVRAVSWLKILSGTFESQALKGLTALFEWHNRLQELHEKP